MLTSLSSADRLRIDITSRASRRPLSSVFDVERPHGGAIESAIEIFIRTEQHRTSSLRSAIVCVCVCGCVWVCSRCERCVAVDVTLLFLFFSSLCLCSACVYALLIYAGFSDVRYNDRAPKRRDAIFRCVHRAYMRLYGCARVYMYRNMCILLSPPQSSIF